jgi:hypothetical protein
MPLAPYPGCPCSPGPQRPVASLPAVPGFADISSAAQVNLRPRPPPMPDKHNIPGSLMWPADDQRPGDRAPATWNRCGSDVARVPGRPMSLWQRRRPVRVVVAATSPASPAGRCRCGSDAGRCAGHRRRASLWQRPRPRPPPAGVVVAAMLAGAGRCGSDVARVPRRPASLWQRPRPRRPPTGVVVAAPRPRPRQAGVVVAAILRKAYRGTAMWQRDRRGGAVCPNTRPRRRSCGASRPSRAP